MSAPGPRQLVSWKEIADYLGRDVRTVVRWEKDKNLPVHRVPGGKRQAVYAFSDELDAWVRGDKPVALMSIQEEQFSPAPVAGAKVGTRSGNRRAEWAMLVLVVVVAFSLLGFLFRPQSQLAPPLRLAHVSVPPGIVIGPALSPDGKQVAYSLRKRGSSQWAIYVQLLGAGDPVRLTNSEQSETHPAWSPDGRYIAYLMIDGDNESIAVAPALGGSARVISRLHDPHSAYYVAWADGKRLVFTDRDNDSESVSTYFVDVDSGQRSRFFSAPDVLTRDYFGAFSPDGKLFAFVRGSSTTFLGDLYVMSAGGGTPHRLTWDGFAGVHFAWTRNSREIVSEQMQAGADTYQAARIDVESGRSTVVFPSAVSVVFPSIARNGRGLAYVQYQDDANIRRVDLTAERPSTSAVVDSQDRDVDPACSRDGKRLAFLSYRAGGADLWIADAVGGNLRRLSYLAGTPVTNSGVPDWSPDDRWIAFTARRNRQADVAVTDVASGELRYLTSHPANDSFPRWSHDGKWIYFSSDRSGRYEIWRTPSTGGVEEQVTRAGGFVAQESADGKYIYYGKPDADGIWRMAVGGGEEQQVLRVPIRRYAWSLTQSGIYFVAGATFPGLAVHFYDFGTRTFSHAYDYEHFPQYAAGKISACERAKTLFISETDVIRSDLIWAENFQ